MSEDDEDDEDDDDDDIIYEKKKMKNILKMKIKFIIKTFFIFLLSFFSLNYQN
jgi:hypothetical protein